jgi:hypothetical protein
LAVEEALLAGAAREVKSNDLSFGVDTVGYGLKAARRIDRRISASSVEEAVFYALFSAIVYVLPGGSIVL